MSSPLPWLLLSPHWNNNNSNWWCFDRSDTCHAFSSNPNKAFRKRRTVTAESTETERLINLLKDTQLVGSACNQTWWYGSRAHAQRTTVLY